MSEKNTRCSWSGLSFTVTDNAGDDEIRVIHDCAECDAQGVAELTTFVDRSGRLSIDMSG